MRSIICILLSFIALAGYGQKPTTDFSLAARQVISRQIGRQAEQIRLACLPQSTRDTFAYQCHNSQLTIQGSSPTAMTYAFYQYLKRTRQGMFTWSGTNARQTVEFVDHPLTTGRSPYSYRYFLNVCTFGYTMPYWDWARWEQELDLMALHGTNMILASVASEAIAERVWCKLGLTQEQARSFFTGPAYLPWHRMGNLNSWNGPLTDAWQQGQITLQHKIIDRMRALGMHPIAPAFAGFVPEQFVEAHPGLQVKKLTWGGFDDRLNAYVLSPESPYFKQIGRLFVEEWEKEFGKNTFYQSDSFNEMEIPVEPGDSIGKWKLLEQYGDVIYRSIAEANPDAVWVTQGWTFGYQHKMWDSKSLQALLRHVPDDKMLIIDLANDYPKWIWKTQQTWKVQHGYYGKQWVFSYVPNFGGKTLPTGDMQMYASASAEALHHSERGNMVGFGSAPEGIENNDVIYELLADMGWTDKAVDLDLWIKDYCEARYGGYPSDMQKAWQCMLRSVYGSLYSYPRFTWQTVTPDSRRVSTHALNDTFLSGVAHFLRCARQLGSSPLYRSDAISLASLYLGTKADRHYTKALDLKAAGKQQAASAELHQTIDLLTKADRLLASHPTHRLDRWIQFARNHGITTAEKNRYESDAKRLITIWGGFQEDYAARFWNALIAHYYIPRIRYYFDHGRPALMQWEEQWVKQPLRYKPQPDPHALDTACHLVQQMEKQVHAVDR